MNKLTALDGRHKLAILAAIASWGLSIKFSQEGFALGSPNGAWIGWVLAGIITVVELAFNSETKKLSQTLIITGLLCYFYGVWTNITGFWDYQNPGMIFELFNTKSILSVLVGSVLEILPEPLFMWGLGARFEGDLVGNVVGLWSGNLQPATPEKPKQYQTNNSPLISHLPRNEQTHRPAPRPNNNQTPNRTFEKDIRFIAPEDE